MTDLHRLSDSSDTMQHNREEDGYGAPDDIPRVGRLSRISNAVSANRGVLCGIASGCAVALQFSFVKAFRDQISPFQLAAFRSVPFLLAVSCVTWEDGSSYDHVDAICYLSYGLLNSITLLLAYFSLKFADVGNVTAITTNLPIPASLLAMFFLGEHISPLGYLALLINSFGLFLVSKPPFLFSRLQGEHSESQDSVDNAFSGSMIALGSLAALALSSIFSRKLANRGNADAMLVSFLAGAMCLILSGIGLLFTETWEPFSREEWFYGLIIGVLAVLGNVFFVTGLRYESIRVITVLLTINSVVAFLIGVIAFGEIPDIASLVGVFLIIGSSFGSLWRD